MPGEELLQQPRGEVLGVRQQRVLWTKRDHFAGSFPWSPQDCCSSRVEGSLVSCPIILPVTQMRRICTREPGTMSWWSDSDMVGSPSFLHCNSTSLRRTHVPFECANRGRTLRGIMANHSGLCLTVFSASNYCGSVGAMVATGCRCNWNAGIWCTLPFFCWTSGNRGGVLVLRPSMRRLLSNSDCGPTIDRRTGISQQPTSHITQRWSTILAGYDVSPT